MKIIMPLNLHGGIDLYYRTDRYICWSGAAEFFPRLKKVHEGRYKLTLSDAKFKGGKPIEFERGYKACWYANQHGGGHGLYWYFSTRLHLFLKENSKKILWVKIELDEAQDS